MGSVFGSGLISLGSGGRSSCRRRCRRCRCIFDSFGSFDGFDSFGGVRGGTRLIGDPTSVSAIDILAIVVNVNLGPIYGSGTFNFW